MPDLLKELHEALLAADSATEVLERLYGPPVVAQIVACAPMMPTAEQRRRLCLGPLEPWAHRRVVLAAQGQAVSHADLWYVPHRLHPEMVEALRTSDRPFGKVVRTLRPRRTTLFSRLSSPREPPALEHRALLAIEGQGAWLPIAEVHERYGAEVPPAS